MLCARTENGNKHEKKNRKRCVIYHKHRHMNGHIKLLFHKYTHTSQPYTIDDCLNFFLAESKQHLFFLGIIFGYGPNQTSSMYCNYNHSIKKCHNNTVGVACIESRFERRKNYTQTAAAAVVTTLSRFIIDYCL